MIKFHPIALQLVFPPMKMDFPMKAEEIEPGLFKITYPDPKGARATVISSIIHEVESLNGSEHYGK